MKKVIILLGMAVCLGMTPAYAADDKPPPEFEYFKVPALMLPVINDQGLTQQVSIAVSIEMPYGNQDKMATYGPRLVDAYIRDLFGALGSGQLLVKGVAIDIEKLKTRLTAVTERVLGEDKAIAKDLLLQAVQQHRI